jgi:hypothetical protein
MDIPEDVYSHHDNGCGDDSHGGCEDDIGQDDTGHGDEDFDMELMRNVALDVLLQIRNKGFNNFEMFNKVLRDLLYKECKGCDKEHTMLWMMLELLKLKARNTWSTTSFSVLLDLLTKVFNKAK